MKLKKFLKYYPRDKFLRLCLLNNSEEKVYLVLIKLYIPVMLRTYRLNSQITK